MFTSPEFFSKTFDGKISQNSTTFTLPRVVFTKKFSYLGSRNLKKKKLRNGVMAIHSNRREKNELVQIIKRSK